MRSKAHINFLVEYDNINIFNIWISNLYKVIRTHDVIFDENNFYKVSQIILIQIINESFLINNDTLNILKSKFIKIEKLSNISNKKNLALIFTDIIKTNKMNENDEKNSFIKRFKIDEDETDKNNQR